MPAELDASTIIIGLLASIGGILMGWAALRKSRSDGQGSVVTNAVSLVNELQEELGRLKVEVSELKAREKERETKDRERDLREAELLRGVRILIGQLEKMGARPEWYPPAPTSDTTEMHSHDRGDPPKTKQPGRRGL